MKAEMKALKKKAGFLACGAVLTLALGVSMLTGCSKSKEAENKQETSAKEEKQQPSSQEKNSVDISKANEEVMGLKAYYKFQDFGQDSDLKDSTGNGFDAKIMGKYTMDGSLEEGAVFLTSGAYFEMPSELFAGEDTLSVSVWLKNYSGAINTSAVYVGTKGATPVNYWLLNPSNVTGNLKSVITDSDNPKEPFNTEVGFSPAVASNGQAGPATGMGWNHYVTVITPKDMTLYMNGEKVGTVAHNKKLSEFGADIVAYIGKSSYSADATYTGFVKEVKIYDMAMSQEEITEEYNRCKEEKKTNATKTDIFIADRADPYITRGSDGYYYFTASYPMYGATDPQGYDRIVLRRAKTIEGLKDAKEIVIWDESESTTAHRFIWAPEIHEIDGKWYVYFAASGQADNVWDINCHVIACDGKDPYKDSWTDKGKFQAVEGDSLPFTGFSLDMTYFECNGKHYVIWAQKVGDSNVYMAQIDPKEPWKTTSRCILLTKPEYYWEKVSIPVNEGPAVMIHDGKVFVAFSASATGPEYCLGLLYADEKADLMDVKSWTKATKPLLTSEDLIGEYGPGHNSFVQDENGDWVFVYHSRSEECYQGKCGYGNEDPLYDPCRSARIRKVVWDENGMPILNR